MELWRITQPAGTESLDYLKAIIQSGLGAQTEAISVERLALLILQECGNMRPIYNSYSVFYRMSINWFGTRYEQITHLIHALLEDYLPYQEFNWHEREVLDGRIKTDDTRNITEDNTHVNNGQYETTTDETKTENSTSTTTGSYSTDTDESITENNTISNSGAYNNTGHSDDVTETGISADNENSFQPRERVARSVDDTLANTHNDTTTETKSTSDNTDVANEHTDTTTAEKTTKDNIDINNTHTDTDTDDKNKVDVLDGLRKQDDETNRDFYGHKTSNQLLALQELEIAQQNIYDCIVKWFTDALFIGVWE